MRSRRSATSGVHQLAALHHPRRPISGWLGKLNPWKKQEKPPEPSNPFAALGGKPPGGMPNPKQMMDMMKMMSEMQAKMQQAQGGGAMPAGKDAPPVPRFEDLINMQRAMSMGGPKPTPEAMAAFQQSLAAGRPGTAAASAGAASERVKIANPASAQSAARAETKHVTRPMPKVGGGGGASASANAKGGSKAADAASSSSAPAGGGGEADLGPEIEALFAELRAMREKKNKYKERCEAAERQLQSAVADVQRLEGVREDLRQRLTRAEKDVSLLNTETITLKEKMKDAKAAAKALRDAQLEVKRLQQQQAADSGPAVERLSREQHAQAVEARRLRRQLTRLGASNPFVGFGSSAHDIASFGRDYGWDANSGGGSGGAGTDAAPAHDLTQYAGAAVGRMHQAVRERLLADWAALSRQDAPEVAVATAEAYWGAVVPHARYDAVAFVDGDATDLINVFADASRFRVETTADADVGGRTKVTVQSVPGSMKPVADGGSPVGPAALLRAYATLAEHCQEQQGEGGPPRALSRVVYVCPFVSASMLADDQRATIRIIHTRSSGPGGQATNVSESAVQLTLLIDGAPVARAESQDSRSSVQNTETAKARLHDEALARYNHNISRRSSNVVRAAGALEEARPIPKDTWAALWRPVQETVRASRPGPEATLVDALEFAVVSSRKAADAAAAMGESDDA